MAGRDVLITAVPSVFVRATAARMKPFLKKGQLVVTWQRN